MKILKAICIILGIVFFAGLFVIPSLLGEVIKSYEIEWTLLLIDFLFLLICFCGYKVLKDREEIDRDYMELGKKKP
jgi:hypothetical protein